MPAIIKLQVDEFDRLTATQGWNTDADRARGLRLDPATISRVRAGTQRPGAAFIDACLVRFGAGAYPQLFERGDEPAGATA